jgi:hypothetical protein
MFVHNCQTVWYVIQKTDNLIVTVMKKEITTGLQQMAVFQYFAKSHGYFSVHLTLIQPVLVFLGLLLSRTIGKVVVQLNCSYDRSDIELKFGTNSSECQDCIKDKVQVTLRTLHTV